jgi:hypothetical protein
MKRFLTLFCLCSFVMPWACVVKGEDTAAKKTVKSVTVYHPEILPKEIAGPMAERIAEVIGMFLERAGMSEIEIAEATFAAPETDDPAQLADAFAKFIAKHPPKTEYALFARITAPKHKIKQINIIIADKTGKAVFTNNVDEATYKKEKRQPSDEPLTVCLFITERLGKVWDLADPLRQGAPEGKMAELMKKRSALPPDKEIADMNKRMDKMKTEISTAKITVYPVHLRQGADQSGAVQLAKMISEAGICQAESSNTAVKLEVKGDPNEQKVLWDTARAFRDFIRKNPPTTQYALLADYMLNPASDGKHEAGAVHLILCDKSGDWILVDYQNSHHEDFQSIAPKTVDDCNRLAVKRLKGILSKY